MTIIDPIHVVPNAIEELIRYTKEKQLNRFSVISDTNTYQALGEQVEKALKAEGYDVVTVVHTGDEVIADAHYLIDTLLRVQLGDCMLIAVGSGTLTDITRFVSHRTGRSFISMPTAPSVDGFTSIGAPLVIHGVKQTIVSQPPVALFADLPTLCAAPQELVAAGFADMIGKITSLADWRLGSLLWDEPIDDAIFKRSQAAIDVCLKYVDGISERSTEGISELMHALVESGLCMMEFGSSRPASGAEHHASHYWEMMLLQEERPAVLHGAKVGLALIHVAEQYARIRGISRQELLDRLEGAVMPERDAEVAVIKEGYGLLADGVVAEHGAFLDMTEEEYDALKRRIVDNWDAIQELAAQVPPSEVIKGHLAKVGAVTHGDQLGLTEDEVKRGHEYGHFLRNRFTVMKLSRVLGLPLN